MYFRITSLKIEYMNKYGQRRINTFGEAVMISVCLINTDHVGVARSGGIHLTTLR